MPCRRAIMAILISPMIVPIIITATGLFFFYLRTANGARGSHSADGLSFVCAQS
jgi:putative spermidine/putrescine transport system permease protein